MILNHHVGMAIVAPVLGVEHHALERSLGEWLSPVPVRLALVAELLDIIQKQRINEMLISAVCDETAEAPTFPRGRNSARRIDHL